MDPRESGIYYSERGSQCASDPAVLLLELAIDGLRLAAVNTPNMLSTPLSVMAALVLGEFSVESGWFSSEVMLAMAFVAIANYTQANYELGYALKFMRIPQSDFDTAFRNMGLYCRTDYICAGAPCE